MNAMLLLVISCFILACTSRPAVSQQSMVSQIPSQDSSRTCVYAWDPSYSIEDKLMNRIAVPEGFVRVPVAQGSFGEWLRNLPLKADRPKVKLFDGSLKYNQGAHYAVIDIDVGTRDLQQCADAVMRLRSEFLFSTSQSDKLRFDFTSGFTCDFHTWSQGFRPIVSGNDVRWEKKVSAGSDYTTFRSYLTTIFMYCGTWSLSKELKPKELADISIGDVFIQGGFPGHAVLVVDVAQHTTTGEKVFLLAQSYMPAQDIHVLQNFTDQDRSPWYSNELSGPLQTPEWTFESGSLKAF